MSTLYQINIRIWLAERARELGRPATLRDLPDAFLDELARSGFDWIWPLGVWQTGAAGERVARSDARVRADLERALPEFGPDDVWSSPFAIQRYVVSRALGGPSALADLRSRLRERGMRLLLDFVPNHTAPDHPWVREHPEYYVSGSEEDLAREPQNYLRLGAGEGAPILAYGRDPYFDGWSDTLQLDYRHPGLQEAMAAQLAEVARQCDGVRCDMAMLLLPEVFEKTWGERALPGDGAAPDRRSFWSWAIARVRDAQPGFVFMAEVYWDLEAELQRQGFDYTYDKRLYDRLRDLDAAGVRAHLEADLDFQRSCVRFLENHDEPRAAAAFPLPVARAAAVVAFLTPGLRFLHEGQLEGRRVRVPMQLARRPQEPPDPEIRDFYRRLLPCLARAEPRDGRWQLLPCHAAWDGNPSWERFIAFAWEADDRTRLVVAVNYAATRGQCYLPLPFEDWQGRTLQLDDLLGDEAYERDGSELATRGLYLDLPEWGHHVFRCSVCP